MKARKYSPEFKVKVVMESLRSNKSYVELAAEHKVPKTNIKEWHDKLLNNAADIFKGNIETTKKIKSLHNEIDNLHKTIGELTVEHGYLKKKLLSLQQVTGKV